MKKALSLVEVMIVVSIIGILAAIVTPLIQNNVATSKAAAAKQNLRVFRTAIELYRFHHKDVLPGYPGGDIAMAVNFDAFENQLTGKTNQTGDFDGTGPDYHYGPYLSKVPENPFNNKSTFKILVKLQPFPDEATGEFGWIYHATTGEIKIDITENDENGEPIYGY